MTVEKKPICNLQASLYSDGSADVHVTSDVNLGIMPATMLLMIVDQHIRANFKVSAPTPPEPSNVKPFKK